MALPPVYPCPKCRKPIPAEFVKPGGAICNHCGHQFRPTVLTTGRPDAATILKFIKLPVAGDLDGQTNEVLQQLKKAGLPAQFDPTYNSRFQFANFARVIYIPWGEAEYDLVLVTTVPWSDRSSGHVLQDFMGMAKQSQERKEKVRFRIASACPLPGAIEYLFGAYPRGAFEIQARLGTGLSESAQAVAQGQPPELAKKAVGWIQSAFGRSIDLRRAAQIASLDALVLEELRRGTPKGHPLPSDAFIPMSSLLLIGCLFGELLRVSGKLKAAWKNNPKAPFTLAMSIQSGKAAVINPIGKAIKMFEKGEPESMKTFAESLLGPLGGRA